jgi:hypothetical protein
VRSYRKFDWLVSADQRTIAIGRPPALDRHKRVLANGRNGGAKFWHFTGHKLELDSHRGIENPRVGGSIPPQATTTLVVFSHWRTALATQVFAVVAGSDSPLDRRSTPADPLQPTLKLLVPIGSAVGTRLLRYVDKSSIG